MKAAAYRHIIVQKVWLKKDRSNPMTDIGLKRHRISNSMKHKTEYE